MTFEVLETIKFGANATTQDDGSAALVQSVAGNAAEIARNVEEMRLEWSNSGALASQDERERILMELRHDLSDALRAVRKLEELITA